MLCQIFEHRHPQRRFGRGPACSDGVHEIRVDAEVQRIRQKQRHTANGTRHIRAQQLGRWRQPEPTRAHLLEDSQTCQEAQDTVEPVGLRAGRSCEILSRLRSAG
jgi:hypothetical protein